MVSACGSCLCWGRYKSGTRKDPAASTESTAAGWRRGGKRVRGRWCVDWQPTVPWPVATQPAGVVQTAPVQVHHLRPGLSGRSLPHTYAIHLPDLTPTSLFSPKPHVCWNLRQFASVSKGCLDLLWCPEMSLISTPMSRLRPDGHIGNAGPWLPAGTTGSHCLTMVGRRRYCRLPAVPPGES